jgi:hypothetical protein
LVPPSAWVGEMSQRVWSLFSIALVLVAGGLYVGSTVRCGSLGFPLDDGWIHQTYARNLAQTGQFAYVPGRPSAGSTSPLWTLLLAAGYVLRVPSTLWAYILGGAAWLLSAWASAALARRLFPERRAVAMWVGLACLLEWHMAWAAFSGMETMLFVFLSMLLIERYAAKAHPFLLGLIGGMLLLARPEGVVLIGLLLLVMLLERVWVPVAEEGIWSKGVLLVLVDLGAGLAALIVPYVVFNEIVSGQPFPNTFYAKQAEYQAYLAMGLHVRLWRVFYPPLIGAQILLLPAFVWRAATALGDFARRDKLMGASISPFLRLLPAAWWAAYLGIYALRMPVNYQHGRYLMPTIPFLLLYGIVGMSRWLRPRSPRVAVRLISRAMPLAVGCTFVAFLLLGAQAYADDVCVINGEMVDVARWLSTSTPADALVAAHDIGAIGYLGKRPLLDLAGLITPEVIPFIRDEERLLEFVLAQEADYLVTFPSWYPQMTADERLAVVYQTDYPLTREKGGDNMAVYEIRD